MPSAVLITNIEAVHDLEYVQIAEGVLKATGRPRFIRGRWCRGCHVFEADTLSHERSASMPLIKLGDIATGHLEPNCSRRYSEAKKS